MSKEKERAYNLILDFFLLKVNRILYHKIVRKCHFENPKHELIIPTEHAISGSLNSYNSNKCFAFAFLNFNETNFYYTKFEL